MTPKKLVTMPWVKYDIEIYDFMRERSASYLTLVIQATQVGQGITSVSDFFRLYVQSISYKVGIRRTLNKKWESDSKLWRLYIEQNDLWLHGGWFVKAFLFKHSIVSKASYIFEMKKKLIIKICATISRFEPKNSNV